MKIWIVRMPQMRLLNIYFLHDCYVAIGRYTHRLISSTNFFPICIKDGRRNGNSLRFVCFINNIRRDNYINQLIRQVFVMNKYPSASNYIRIIRISYVYWISAVQPHITVNTTKIGKIKFSLRFSRRIGRVIAIINPNRHNIFLPIKLYFSGNVDNYRQIAAKMFLHQFTIYPDFTFPHHCFKMEKYFLTQQVFWNFKMFAIPGFSLIVNTSTRLLREIFKSMWCIYNYPFRIIETALFCFIGCPFVKTPPYIKIENFSSSVFDLEESGSREFLSYRHRCIY